MSSQSAEVKEKIFGYFVIFRTKNKVKNKVQLMENPNIFQKNANTKDWNIKNFFPKSSWFAIEPIGTCGDQGRADRLMLPTMTMTRPTLPDLLD